MHSFTQNMFEVTIPTFWSRGDGRHTTDSTNYHFTELTYTERRKKFKKKEKSNG